MGASVQLISFLTETGTGDCTAMQKDTAQNQAVPLPLGSLMQRTGRKDTSLRTSTALKLGGPAPPPAGRHGKPWGQSWQL